jgi:Arc/MetJ-type ribon-helix-helix transcriptional regulator
MTIRLPEDLECSIRAEVAGGHFASEEDLVTQAVRTFLDRRHEPSPATGEEPNDDAARKPVWERALDLTADVPDEVWDGLPTDLSEQHDHYIYGTPKRPPS